MIQIISQQLFIMLKFEIKAPTQEVMMKKTRREKYFISRTSKKLNSVA
jgi:hypothetical protein